VLLMESGDGVPLEDEVRQLLESGGKGVVALLGPDGAGKTTALRHLAAVLGFRSDLVLLDEPDLAEIAAAGATGLVVYTAAEAMPSAHRAVFHLAPWGPDDWLEYLLAAHRPRCTSVLARVRESDGLLLGVLPERWAVILDRLAADESLPDARRALHRYLAEFLSDTDLLERVRSACLNAAVEPGAELAGTLAQVARPGFGSALVRALRCPAARLLLAAERIAADLHGDAACDYLAHRLSRDLVQTAAGLCAGDEAARAHLVRLLAGPSWSHAMSASLLHALKVGWVPDEAARPCLAGAYLDGAAWPGVLLAGADLSGTNLSRSNLRGAILVDAVAPKIVLRHACLQRARLDRLRACQADLAHADLSEAQGERALFQGAVLAHANLSGAALAEAVFVDADLTEALFVGADLTRANFADTRIDGADFRDANLTGACLSGLRLGGARWEGACFHKAALGHCDLEGVDLSGANFTDAFMQGALLTGSTMPDADFRGADLYNTGLADVDWQGADLRGANLRGASFHMGSSRSGLVGSPLACEGSRTGFYTDEYDEQSYKAPEEIRKANLCGADLRGALLENVDFYLVDLRGAHYDVEQGEHLRRCGAILETRA
jgi:uncharacterized protein YjbI with pentapeptide repeats